VYFVYEMTFRNMGGLRHFLCKPPDAVTTPVQNESQPRRSPDEREVLYLSVPTDPSPEELTTIMAVPVEGGTARRILNDRGIWTHQCARAPSNLGMINRGRG
jgi:hypothetical protein